MSDAHPEDRSDFAIGVYYTLAFPLAIVLAFVATFLAFKGFDALPGRTPDGWRGWLIVAGINLVPSVLAGCGLYWTIGRDLRGAARSTSRHGRRALPLYVIAVAFTAIIVAGTRKSPGFGLVVQIFLWPAAAALGGALGDWRAWRSRPRTPAATDPSVAPLL